MGQRIKEKKEKNVCLRLYHKRVKSRPKENCLSTSTMFVFAFGK